MSERNTITTREQAVSLLQRARASEESRDNVHMELALPGTMERNEAWLDQADDNLINFQAAVGIDVLLECLRTAELQAVYEGMHPPTQADLDAAWHLHQLGKLLRDLQSAGEAALDERLNSKGRKAQRLLADAENGLCRWLVQTNDGRNALVRALRTVQKRATYLLSTGELMPDELGRLLIYHEYVDRIESYLYAAERMPRARTAKARPQRMPAQAPVLS